MLVAPMACGKALYPSDVASRITAVRTNPGSDRVMEMTRRFDMLERCARLAEEFDLELLLYFRLNDDYFPGLEEDYLDAHPQWWWQSRCGLYPFRGWPCYHHPEVREYKLRLLQEQLKYGVDGALFEVARSHSFYVSPHRQPDFFGFNEPIAGEMRRRTGVDISAYDHMKFLTLDRGVFERIPYVYSAEYVGAAEFDAAAWHWIKGEGFETFLREARGLMKNQRILVQGAFAPPHPVAMEKLAPAMFWLDAAKLARDNVIDGALNSANWSQQKLTDSMELFMLPHFSGVRDAGKQIGAWLNDIFSPTGGEPAGMASIEQIDFYWNKHVAPSSMDFVVIHEADFINRHPQAEQAWNFLRNKSNR